MQGHKITLPSDFVMLVFACISRGLRHKNHVKTNTKSTFYVADFEDSGLKNANCPELFWTKNNVKTNTKSTFYVAEGGAGQDGSRWSCLSDFQYKSQHPYSHTHYKRFSNLKPPRMINHWLSAIYIYIYISTKQEPTTMRSSGSGISIAVNGINIAVIIIIIFRAVIIMLIIIVVIERIMIIIVIMLSIILIQIIVIVTLRVLIRMLIST